MTYEYVHGDAVPSPGLIFDGETYSVEFDGDGVGDGPPDQTNFNDNSKVTVSIPTKEYAIHLIQMVKFTAANCFIYTKTRSLWGT